MTNGNGTNGGGDGGAPAGQGDATASAQGQPGIRVLGQYIKDLSFENPGAPESLRSGGANPSLKVNVNVNARPLADGNFEVELKLDGAATRDEHTLFIAEVCYAGVFALQNVPQEHVHPMLLIECPRLLFPFARQVLADATRQGGFPPLMVDPIDFTLLYRQRLEEAARQRQSAATPAES